MQVMLGPLVCDLPTIQQMAGLASHLHTRFCSVSKLAKDNMDKLDTSKFQLRKNKEYR